ncbi:MAG TPA: glycosyl hydrolase, partial [bacterium]|nr:glycosyl hydrolase [bacterium]
MKTFLNAKCLVVAVVIFVGRSHGFALGQVQYVETVPGRDSFPLVQQNAAAVLCVDSSDWPGVIRAAGDLQADIRRVTDRTPALSESETVSGANVVIIGTVGKSALIDQLVRAEKIDISPIAGKWESFFIQVVPRPLPGVESALVICGSDKRGTIYGVYDLSEQMGVSPWHYWGDVPPRHHEKLFVKAGKFLQGPPSVKYRGIFIND